MVSSETQKASKFLKMELQLKKEQQIMKVLYNNIQNLKHEVKFIENMYYSELVSFSSFRPNTRGLYYQLHYLTKVYKELENIYYNNKNNNLNNIKIFDTEKEANKFLKNKIHFVKLAFKDPEDKNNLRWFVKV